MRESAGPSSSSSIYTLSAGSIRLLRHGERQRALCFGGSGGSGLGPRKGHRGHVPGKGSRGAATLRLIDDGDLAYAFASYADAMSAGGHCAGSAVGCSPLQGRRGSSSGGATASDRVPKPTEGRNPEASLAANRYDPDPSGHRRSPGRMAKAAAPPCPAKSRTC